MEQTRDSYEDTTGCKGGSKDLLRYVMKRVLWLIPVIICVSFIVFALMELAPGTVVDTMLSSAATEEDKAAIMAKYDLDKPMVYRYGKYMLNLVQGDLGISDVTKVPVWDTYISRLPNTLLLSLSSLVIGSSVSIPMGIFAARRAGKIADTATTTFTLVGMSMPSFWLGLLLMYVFCFWLGWLPAGRADRGFADFILPAVCSSFMLMASSTRQTRSSMLEVLKSDYLRTARAKGIPEKVIVRKHALGNAMIPILTTIGSSLSISLAGMVIIETVFTWPGVGRATVDAVNARDVTATCGLVIMTTILYVVMQLIVDLLYAFVDPRIRAQYSGSNRKRILSSTSRLMPIPEGVDIPDVSTEDSLPELAIAHEDVDDISYFETPSNMEAITELKATISGDTEDSGFVGNKNTFVGNSDKSAEADRSANEGSVYANQSDEEIKSIIKKFKKRNRLGEVFHSIRYNKSAMAGLTIVVFLILVFLGSLFISYESITEMHMSDRYATPSLSHPFGTDAAGRDSFLRTIYGIRYSLVIGLGATGFATIVGVMFGSFAGYYGGIVEDIIMRASDVLSSIPGMLLGMVIVTVLGQNLQNLIIAVGVTATPIFIRISRASILTVRNHEFVEASRSIGYSNFRIIFSQVLPNGLSPIIVTFTSSMGMSILTAASLSFLGLGVPVPRPEWGALISLGKGVLRTSPHLTTFPGLFIMVTVLAFNLLGDGLRDALDPKLKK